MAAIVLIPGAAELVGEVSNSHPLFILAVYSSANSAILVVLAYGVQAGVRLVLSRLAVWRIRAGWWAFLILGVPAIYLAGAAVGGLGDWRLPEGLPGAMLFMLLLGPVEELGWRGFMQPLLQRGMAPLWAGLIVGVIWKTGTCLRSSPGAQCKASGASCRLFRIGGAQRDLHGALQLRARQPSSGAPALPGQQPALAGCAAVRHGALRRRGSRHGLATPRADAVARWRRDRDHAGSTLNRDRAFPGDMRAGVARGSAAVSEPI